MFNPHSDSASEKPATAMRECLSNRMPEQEIAPRLKSEGLTRIFSPSELDLDDLAEAFRSLLWFTNPPQIGSPSRPIPDLLSLRRRGTHVVEAKETP